MKKQTCALFSIAAAVGLILLFLYTRTNRLSIWGVKLSGIKLDDES